jgi:hypothetical protein
MNKIKFNLILLLFIDIHKELMNMIRNARKCKVYYELNKSDLIKSKKEYRDKRKKKLEIARTSKPLEIDKTTKTVISNS